MLLSCVVYTSLAALLFVLARRVAWQPLASGQAMRQQHSVPWEYVASVFIFAVIAGARWHTGYDHASYVSQYVTLQNYHFFTRDFEPGFMLLTQAFASSGLHFFFYFFTIAAIELAAIYVALRHHPRVLSVVMLLLVLGPTFVHLMNTVRQGLVECFVPLVVMLLYDKKKLAAAILIVLLTLFHYTAALLLLLLPLRPLELKVNRTVLVVLFVLVVALSIYQVWFNGLIAVSADWLANVSQSYAAQLGRLVEGEVNMAHIGPVKVLLLTTQFITLWLMRDVSQHYGSHKGISLLIVLASVYVLGTNLFSSTTCFMQRPFELFTICYLIVAAYTVLLLWDTRRKLWAGVLLGMHCSYIYLAIFKAVYAPDVVTTPFLYNTFLF